MPAKQSSQAKAANTHEPPAMAPPSKEKFDQWHESHGFARFSPSWNRVLARRMRDPRFDDDCRVLAWLTLFAAGNQSDWPVDSERKEKFQRDCADDTGLDRRRVSECVVRLAARGELMVPDAKGLFPDGRRGPAGRLIQIDGENKGRILSDPPGSVSPSFRHAFTSFKISWLERHPVEAKAREEAAAIVDAIDVQILSEWKRESKENSAEDGEDSAKGADGVVREGRTTCPKGSDILSERVPENGALSLVSVKPLKNKPASSSSSGVVGHQRTTTTTPAPGRNGKPEKTDQEVIEVAEATGLESSAAAKLVHDCRSRKHSISVAEILELWRRKFDQLRTRQRSADNFVGLMLTAIPNMVSSG